MAAPAPAARGDEKAQHRRSGRWGRRFGPLTLPLAGSSRLLRCCICLGLFLASRCPLPGRSTHIRILSARAKAAMASSRKLAKPSFADPVKTVPQQNKPAHHDAAVDADGGDHDAEQRQAISALETAPFSGKGTPRRRGPAP